MGGRQSGAEQSGRENRMRDQLPDLSELLDAAHGTPVELDAGADTVDAGAKDQDVRRPKGEVMGGAPVGQVQVVRLSWPLSCNCVNLLHRWADPQFLTQLANSQLGAKGKGTETWSLGEGYRLSRGGRSQSRGHRGKHPREGQRPPKPPLALSEGPALVPRITVPHFSAQGPGRHFSPENRKGDLLV